MALSRRRFLTLASASTSGVALVSPLFKSLQARANHEFLNLNTLFISLDIQENYLNIKSEFQGKIYSHLVSNEASQLVSSLENLYTILNRNSLANKPLETISLVKDLGQIFFEPIDTLISQSSHIRFILNENYLRFPLDLLHYGENPLFLEKPVSYSFSKDLSPNLIFSDDLSALIISDPTADPEQGAYFLKQILASADYYDIQDINLETLNSTSHKDLILISAHGAISFNHQDHIILGDEELYPFHLCRLTPKLVYLDSCKLGVSNEFIQSLRAVKTNYYLAPIISNEAGNSSTQTIKFFFKYLKERLAPELALFHTRIDLYNYFKKFNNWQMLMWRAFPFRVYQLN